MFSGKKSIQIFSDEGENAENPEPGHTPPKEIDELIYLKNLKINFLENKNLTGRHFDRYIDGEKEKYRVTYDKQQNLDRAIKDFEGILKFKKKDHAMAHYCLAKAYSYKGDTKIAQQHMNKVSDIISRNPKWAKYFEKLVPSSEINEFVNSLNIDSA